LTIMRSSVSHKNFKLIKRIAIALILVCLPFLSCKMRAQYTPVLSGGAGFLSFTSGGSTSFELVTTPLIALPVGPHLLFEGRGNLLDSITPASTGGYNTARFFGLGYMQADVLLTKHMTFVGGYFLTPFGTYNQRLTPIWISNFQDAPLIYGIGNMKTGSSTGGMLTGNAVSTEKFSVSYSAYYSAGSTNVQVKSQRGSGGQVSVYFPNAGLEVGTSYGHRLDSVHENDFGTHVWWEPAKGPVAIRSEYAHAPNSQGYWIEADFRLPDDIRHAAWLGRLEPVARLQQAFRNSPDTTDGLPSVDTQKADFGLDYHFPHEVRINASYGRRFASTGNSNVWQAGMTYRFLTPTWKGKK
jgi:hypothetical protein